MDLKVVVVMCPLYWLCSVILGPSAMCWTSLNTMQLHLTAPESKALMPSTRNCSKVGPKPLRACTAVRCACLNPKTLNIFTARTINEAPEEIRGGHGLQFCPNKEPV